MSTCKCKIEIEGQLRERFISTAPEATEHDVELMGYTLMVTDASLESRGCMDIALQATYPLKKGGTKLKNTKQKMIFSYCPFCGVKYPTSEPA